LERCINCDRLLKYWLQRTARMFTQ